MHKNKTVIVTAGNRGGGAAVSLRFAASGANIVIIAPKETGIINAKVEEVADKIIRGGGKAMTIEVNLLDAGEINSAVGKIVSHFGSIDILVNNFSTLSLKNTAEIEPSEFNKVMGNIFSTFFFSKACIPHLKNSSNPHVINISPPYDVESAKLACEHHLTFSISKYGMSFCTTGMAEEFKKDGIAFNSLWQERPVSTATLSDNFENEVVRGSNRPEIYAEAAYLMSLKPSKDFTGNFCVDEQVLIEHGVDVKQYAVDPRARPIKDIFLPGVDYSVLKIRSKESHDR